MNKLKLTTLLLGGSLSANAQFIDTSSNDYVTYPAQDTICTMITKENRFEFNYYTSEIIKKSLVDSVNVINVNSNEVLLLHLYTNKLKKYKVVTIHDGHPHEQYLRSRDNTYTVDGPANVIVFTK